MGGASSRPDAAALCFTTIRNIAAVPAVRTASSAPARAGRQAPAHNPHIALPASAASSVCTLGLDVHAGALPHCDTCEPAATSQRLRAHKTPAMANVPHTAAAAPPLSCHVRTRRRLAPQCDERSAHAPLLAGRARSYHRKQRLLASRTASNAPRAGAAVRVAAALPVAARAQHRRCLCAAAIAAAAAADR
jgi:hypothetical protein